MQKLIKSYNKSLHADRNPNPILSVTTSGRWVLALEWKINTFLIKMETLMTGIEIFKTKKPCIYETFKKIIDSRFDSELFFKYLTNLYEARVMPVKLSRSLRLYYFFLYSPDTSSTFKRGCRIKPPPGFDWANAPVSTADRNPPLLRCHRRAEQPRKITISSELRGKITHGDAAFPGKN